MVLSIEEGVFISAQRISESTVTSKLMAAPLYSSEVLKSQRLYPQNTTALSYNIYIKTNNVIVAKATNTCTELYHSFIQYTGSYTFRQWSAIILDSSELLEM
jgi:hypothetical protein